MHVMEIATDMGQRAGMPAAATLLKGCSFAAQDFAVDLQFAIHTDRGKVPAADSSGWIAAD